MADVRTLLLSIDSPASNIENALQQILKPYTPGIYIKGNELPSIIPNEYFYRIDRLAPKNLKEIQVRTIEDIMGNIFNEDGEIVVTDRIANSKSRLLSTLPTVPAYGRLIMRAFVRDILDHVQIYKNINAEHRHLQAIFESVINANYHNGKTYRQFEDIVSQNTTDTHTDIIQFLGSVKTWNILIPTFDRDTVRIENTGDYRIQKWMEEHGHEFTYVGKST